MYEELPSPRSIRVLSFKPRTLGSINQDRKTRPRDGTSNKWSDTIHCQLIVTELTDIESYDALSYVWGDPNVREHILVCNGHSVKITANLWSALQDIGTKWPEKRLWVDAICINQENTPERNHQVGMMGDIYSTAKEVIVWVGGQTPLSKDFFKAARLIEAKKDLSLASWDATRKDRIKEDPSDGKRKFLNYL
ncbi:heterokaryon incompatibility protein-domain-containing protein [Xylaria cubensis]|nr:heterokaryon incompatibility protein-domain-containing protein [Xylaria cubensis]